MLFACFYFLKEAEHRRLCYSYKTADGLKVGLILYPPELSLSFASSDVNARVILW